MPLWEQNPKDRANTLGNKRAQDPGPPKGTDNKEEPEAHLCLTGKQCADYPGPETETQASQTDGKSQAGVLKRNLAPQNTPRRTCRAASISVEIIMCQ